LQREKFPKLFNALEVVAQGTHQAMPAEVYLVPDGQEFVADELAARTVGAKPLTEGLPNVRKVAPAFDYYWRSECTPVFNDRVR
jgi:hypothetical protein